MNRKFLDVVKQLLTQIHDHTHMRLDKKNPYLVLTYPAWVLDRFEAYF